MRRWRWYGMAQGSLRACAELVAGLAQHHAVLAIELPGRGALPREWQRAGEVLRSANDA